MLPSSDHYRHSMINGQPHAARPQSRPPPPSEGNARQLGRSTGFSIIPGAIRYVMDAPLWFLSFSTLVQSTLIFFCKDPLKPFQYVGGSECDRAFPDRRALSYVWTNNRNVFCRPIIFLLGSVTMPDTRYQMQT